MCGITGIYYNNYNNKYDNNALEIYQSLLAIQHRGQDGAGIHWFNNKSNIYKDYGLISCIFNYNMLTKMNGNIYISHTRYKTNNILNSFQPFEIQSENLSISLCHNGNIINVKELIYLLKKNYNKEVNNESDSYVLTVYIFEFLNCTINNSIKFEDICLLSNNLHEIIHGSFCILLSIQNFGLVAIRDKNGIRPLCYGKNNNNDYLISSETCSFNHTNYDYINDVEPGETILFNNSEQHYTYRNQITKKILFKPCLFEYIYFARTDSIINNISVYNFRYLTGKLLGKHTKHLNIDYIVPTPETSRTYCYGLSNILNIQIREAIILNRYVNRTFIIENKNNIIEKVRQKFSIIRELVEGKNILLLDDSIVRGNTSKGIVQMLKSHGANNIYFASAAPKIYSPNNFGIYIEKKEELVSYSNKTNKEIAEYIGVKEVIYNSLNDVVNIVKKLNNNIQNMETSMFMD